MFSWKGSIGVASVFAVLIIAAIISFYSMFAYLLDIPEEDRYHEIRIDTTDVFSLYINDVEEIKIFRVHCRFQEEGFWLEYSYQKGLGSLVHDSVYVGYE